MKNVTDFTKKVLDLYSGEITDQVFLFIQNNKDLMHNYLNLINKNELKVINSSIAKAIKSRYSLKNKDQKGDPKSTLIQSYEKFE